MSERLHLMMDDNSPDADEAQISAAVHGRTPSGAPPDDLGTYLQSIRSELCAPPDAQTRWNHLAAMRRTNPVHQQHRARRGIVAIAAATVGLLTVTTGLAAADRLPRSAQDQVARFAEIVGVDLPGNDRAPAASPSQPGPGSDHLTPPRGSNASLPGAQPTTATSGPTGNTVHRGDSAGSDVAPPKTDPPVGPGSPAATPAGPGPVITPPGQSGSTPGQSGSTPGHDGSAPGNSENAPGHSDANPGKSGLAPGHAGTTGNSSSTPTATRRRQLAPEGSVPTEAN